VILENKLLPPADCVKITESVSWAKSQFTIFSETIDEKFVAALHHQKPIYHEEDCEQEPIVIEDNKTSITNTGVILNVITFLPLSCELSVLLLSLSFFR
jgi:hypothetical protein